MSMELKQKQIKQNYNCVGVAYCDLQNLLRYFNKIGYYANVYGWRGDVYIVDDFAICTGYQTIQTVKINDTVKRNIIKKYDIKASKYFDRFTIEKYGSKYFDKIKNQAKKDLNAFINEIKKNIIEY